MPALVTTARSRDAGKAVTLAYGGDPPVSSQVVDMELPSTASALHERIGCLLDQHRAVWTCEALRKIQYTSHCIDLSIGARPVRFAPKCAGRAAQEPETAEVKQQLEADFLKPTSSE